MDSVWNRDSIVAELDTVKTISSVIAYSERMVLSAIEMDQGHPVILHAAAAFYEVVKSSISQQHTSSTPHTRS